jgi:hypothetical protein
MDGSCSTCGEGTNAYNVLVGNHEMKRPLGRPRRRGEDNIRILLIDIGWEVVYWTYLAQDKGQCRVFVNTIMNLRVP